MPTDLPQWTDKDPTDEVDYSLSFVPQLPADDTISGLSWDAVPIGLTIIDTSWAGRLALVKLGDGIPGGFYRLTATVTTTAGRVLQRSATLLVRDL